MRFLLMCFLLSLGFHSIAMAQQIEYRGAVMSYEDGKRIAEAEITNLNTKQKILSNAMGVFSIAGKEGDTLRVTKADYSEMETILRGVSDVIIRLKPSFQLNEVNVYGQSKKDQLDDVMDDFRRKGNYYNGKPPPLAYVLSPISALHGLFGKTPKNARRFQSYMNVELEQSVVDRKFNIAIVQNSTGLSGDDLINFMDLYRPSFRQAENWNEYDVHAYIKRSLDNFEASGRPSASKLPKIEIPKQEK